MAGKPLRVRRRLRERRRVSVVDIYRSRFPFFSEMSCQTGSALKQGSWLPCPITQDHAVQPRHVVHYTYPPGMRLGIFEQPCSMVRPWPVSYRQSP